MVPLVRPNFPDPSMFIPKWQKATKESGLYSNFGPLWYEAAEKLTKIHGRKAFPCSSGTEAVALAIAAAGVNGFTDWISYEAFTFEATRLACRRFCIADPIKTNELARGEDTIIRTAQFGSYREIWTQADNNPLVIDAAGAFGSDWTAFYGMPDVPIAVSFHATKNFPIGEGGCVFLPMSWTDKHGLVKQAMNFGLNAFREKIPGYATNGKMDELHCAMLLAQLERQDVFMERCNNIGAHTIRLYESCPSLTVPYELGAWQSLVVLHHEDPEALVSHLLKNGYIARRMYWPAPEQDTHLFSNYEKGLVAFPSDMKEPELESLVAIVNDMRS